MGLSASAQTFTTLHVFTNSDGASPAGNLLLSGSTLYGTTSNGGSFSSGVVFKMQTDGSDYAVLHNFQSVTNNTNSEGANPAAGLVMSNGVLYGTAANGGIQGLGTIFKIQTSGSNFAVLHQFTGTNDGANPVASLVLSGSELYGTAKNGGDANNGTVFKLNTNGSGFKTLHSFSAKDSNFEASDGENPTGGLILAGNTLYGTTYAGGLPQFLILSSPSGTIFKINTDGSGYTNFYYNSDCTSPASSLIISEKTLFGTMEGGTLFAPGFTPSPVSFGSVFAIQTDLTEYTNLHYFATAQTLNSNVNGFFPVSSLVMADGMLYGTAQYGGIDCISDFYHLFGGTVFRVNADGSWMQILHSFSGGSDGGEPVAGLVFSEETLYGTTQGGGGSNDSGWGTIFKVSTYPDFFQGAVFITNSVYYLAFSNSVPFGYYSTSFFPYVYHMDLGWEYFMDSNDGNAGAYLYDFTTAHYWYSSPALFPYLYDFSLNAWLYYYPNTQQPGHYTSNPRYFYNFTSGQIITL